MRVSNNLDTHAHIRTNTHTHTYTDTYTHTYTYAQSSDGNVKKVANDHPPKVLALIGGDNSCSLSLEVELFILDNTSYKLLNKRINI